MTFSVPAPRSGLDALGGGYPHYVNVTSGLPPDARANVLRCGAGGSWPSRDDQEFERVAALLRDAWMA